MLEKGKHKLKIGTIAKISLVIMLFGYIIFHIIYGDRGIISFMQYNKKYKQTLSELESIKLERQKLQSKVGLMKTDSIDLDMLEEQAKRNLSLTKDNEVILYQHNP
jgi:cell division protein FtsB